MKLALVTIPCSCASMMPRLIPGLWPKSSALTMRYFSPLMVPGPKDPDSTKHYLTPLFGSSKRLLRRSFAPKHFLSSVMGNHDDIHLHSHPFYKSRHAENFGREMRLAGNARRLGFQVLRCRA